MKKGVRAGYLSYLTVLILILSMIIQQAAPVMADEKDPDEIFFFSGKEKDPSNKKRRSGLKRLNKKGKGYNIFVSYDDDANIPEGAVLSVREIREDTVTYDSFVDDVNDELKKEKEITKAARFFDITIMNDGQEVHPAAPVTVDIRLSGDDEVSENIADAKVLHFEENKKGEVAQIVEMEDTSKQDDQKVFATDSFSVYGVVYTVDFWYGEYEYHLPGEGEIMVSRLLGELGLLDTGENGTNGSENTTGSDSVRMADVVDVRFSDESLVKVTREDQTDGSADWKLTSLKAFDSEEKLTIECTDKVVEIRVTDATGDVCKIKETGATYKSIAEAIKAAAKIEGDVEIQMLADDTVSTAAGEIINQTNHRITITSSGSTKHTITTKRNNRLFYIMSDVTFTNIILDGGADKGHSDDEAALFRVQDSGIRNPKVIVGNGAVLQNAKSRGNGGAVCVVHGKLIVEGTSEIKECTTTSKGGAIHIHADGCVEVKGSAKIHDCTASNGGAIHSESDLSTSGLTISGNSEIYNNRVSGNGGAIWTNTPNTIITINGNANIHNNRATTGSVVYTNVKGVRFIIGENANIQNNEATGTGNNGGAIYNSSASVEVSGSPIIRNNYDGTVSGDTFTKVKEKNVLLTGNDITRLTVTGNLTGGDVGIYPTENYTNLHAFGQTSTTLSLDTVGLNFLTNDRTAEVVGSGAKRLVGVPGEGNKVYWYYVCQIVKDGAVKEVFGDLADAAKAVNDYGDGDLDIQMLISGFQMPKASTINKSDGATVTLTSRTTGSNAYQDFGRGSAGKSTVYRGYTGESLFSITGGNLVVDKINLNGHKSAISSGDTNTFNSSAKGGVVKMNASGGTLGITANAILQNSASSDHGGAVWLGDGSAMNFAGTITDCEVDSGNGGAVYQESGSTLNMTAGTMSGNTAKNGAAVYVSGSDGKNTAFNMSGGTITSNTASDGGAVGVNGSNAKLYFSGASKVTGNTMGSNASNVYLSADNNAVINTTTEGLGTGASIGVYVPDTAVGESTLYKRHGAYGTPFGTYVTNTANLDKFVNDRNNRTGVAKTVSGKSLIYWAGLPVVVNVKGNITGTPALDGATFTLTNSAGKTVWMGTSASGIVTIPWDTVEDTVTAEGGTAVFADRSEYTLAQTATVDGYVLPAGSWTLTGGVDEVTCATTASIGNTNRTLDITRDSTDKYNFTVQNDAEPTVTYDANGGVFTGTSPETVDFTNTETSHTYTVSSVVPTREGYAFTGWSGSDSQSYATGDTKLFYRNSSDDDLTLTAQWEEGYPLTISSTFNDTTGQNAYTAMIKAVTYDVDGQKVTVDISSGTGSKAIMLKAGSHIVKQESYTLTDNTVISADSSGQFEKYSTAVSGGTVSDTQTTVNLTAATTVYYRYTRTTPATVILVKEDNTSGDPIQGATFALYSGELTDEQLESATPLWTGTSDSDGRLSIPFTSCPFNANTTYTLKQTGVADGYALPAFTWKFEVQNNYSLRPISVSDQTDSASPAGKMWSLGMGKNAEGKLEVYNENYSILEIQNNISGTYALHGVNNGDNNLLYGKGAFKVNADGSWAARDDNGSIAGHGRLKLAIPASALKSFSLSGTFTTTETSIPVTISNSTEEITLTGDDIYNTSDKVKGTLAAKGGTVTVIFGEAGHNLTVTKLVNGGMGDTTKTFTIYVQSDALGDSASYEDANDSNTVYTVTTDSSSNKRLTLNLKHNDSVTLKDLPEGSYTITEAATGESYETAIKYKVGSSGTETTENTFSLTDDTTVTVTNTLGDIAPTGVTTRILPFALIALAGAGIWLTMRRRRRV